MSRYSIKSKNPEHDVYVGWDPGNQSFFVQVFYWAREEDDWPFVWEGSYAEKFNNLVKFVNEASKYAHFTHFSIQTLQNDKLRNSSKTNTRYGYLGDDYDESPTKGVLEEYKLRFESIFINMGCTTYKKIHPYENVHDFYIKSIYNENLMGRIIFGKEELNDQKITEFISLMANNNIIKALIYSFQPFTNSVVRLANSNRIKLVNPAELKSIAKYWWKISEKVKELLILMNQPFYILDYGIGKKIDNSGVRDEIRLIGRDINLIGGITAMQDAFYIFSSKINEPQLARELEVIWHGIGDWRC